jgi:hypothetical protein
MQLVFDIVQLAHVTSQVWQVLSDAPYYPLGQKARQTVSDK